MALIGQAIAEARRQLEANMDRGTLFSSLSLSPSSRILSPGQELEELRAKAEALEAEARVRLGPWGGGD